MKIRILVAVLLAFVGLSVSEIGGGASAVPTCHGKRATQWLASPGTLYFTAADDVLVGSNGNDLITLDLNVDNGGVDYACALGGDDSIIGVLGEGSIGDGGSGNDYVGADQGGTALGGSGNDTVYGFQASGFGGSGSDLVVVYGEGAVADGGSGNDTVKVEGGATGDGGSGNDTVTNIYEFPDWSAVAIFGGSGNDQLINEGGNPKMDCGSGRDTASSNGATAVRRCETIVI